MPTDHPRETVGTETDATTPPDQHTDGEATTESESPLPDGKVRDRQTGKPTYVEAADDIDWRGWFLVGVVVICFLVIPAFILFIPQMSGFISSLGFSMRQAYLVFPMIPAIILGLTAVWAAVATQSPGSE